MKTKIILFLLLPLLSFSETKKVTWEKEGIKTYEMIKSKYPQLFKYDKASFRDMYIQNGCAILLRYNTDDFFRKHFDKEVKEKDLYVYIANQEMQNSDEENFSLKCLEFSKKNNPLFITVDN